MEIGISRKIDYQIVCRGGEYLFYWNQNGQTILKGKASKATQTFKRNDEVGFIVERYTGKVTLLKNDA